MPSKKTTPTKKLLDLHHKVFDAINKEVVERPELLLCILEARYNKNHTLIYGDPGTGKTMIANCFSRRVIGDNYFEIQCHSQMKIGEMYGEIDQRELMENDKVIVHYENYLTLATYALLDEYFDAHAFVTRANNTMLADRKYASQLDGLMIDLPLESVIAVSNYLPFGDKDYEAPLDRLLYRFEVADIKDDGNWISMFEAGDLAPITAASATFTLAQIHAIQKEVSKVTVPRAITILVRKIGKYLKNKENIRVSDRRQRWSRKALKARAWTSGRMEVNEADILVLQHTLWDNPEDQHAVLSAILEHGNTRLKELNDNVVGITDALNKIKSRLTKDEAIKNTEFSPINARVQRMLKIASDMKADGEDDTEGLQMYKKMLDLYNETIRLTYA